MKIKNLNVRRKMAGIVAFVIMMGAPAAVKAEEKGKTEVKPTLSLVQQERESYPLNIYGYDAIVSRSYDYFQCFFNYPDMQQDIQNMCYLVNHFYMDSETNDQLIKMGAVLPLDPVNGRYDAILSAQKFVNVWSDYIQDTIRETNDSGKLPNLAIMCYDESDRMAVSEMHNLYVKSYLNGNFDANSYYEAFKLATTLNSVEGRRNADDLRPGLKFLLQYPYGNALMQVGRDEMSKRYSIDELSLYFDRANLVRKQWIRNDRETDNCTELGWFVDIFSELQYFCLEESLPNLLKEFEIGCKTR